MECDTIKMDNTKRADAQTKELQALKSQHRQDLGQYERQTAQQLNQCDNQIQALAARKSQELRHALEGLQRQHVDDYLRRIRLRAGSISGIGETTVAKLAACGISTPADFVDVRYVSTGYQNTEARLILPNSRSVRVPGVGESRAASLAIWREGHVQEARRQRNMPTTLPAPRRSAVEARFASEERVLKHSRAQIEQSRGKDRSDLIRHHGAVLRQLTDRQSAGVQAAARALQEANQRLMIMRAEQHAAVKEEQELGRQLAAYRQISYSRFLRIVLTSL
jgi:hypothetical protein